MYKNGCSVVMPIKQIAFQHDRFDTYKEIFAYYVTSTKQITNVDLELLKD